MVIDAEALLKAPFGGRAESNRAGQENGLQKSQAAKGCKGTNSCVGLWCVMDVSHMVTM